MNKELLAGRLNLVQRREMDGHNELAIQNDLIIVYGASDDLMEFDGAISDEIGAFEDGKAVIFLNKKGNLSVRDFDEFTEMLENELIDFEIPHCIVEAIYNPAQIDSTWLITTTIPHVTFDIMEDEDLFCRGIVMSKTDVLNSMK